MSQDQSKGYIAFALLEGSRAQVLKRFPSRFAVVRCDHITYLYGVPGDSELPSAAAVVAHAYVCEPGLEALVVAVNGSTRRRDGSIYHVTLSRDEGRSSVESNALVANEDLWQPLEPFALETRAVWRKI
jgi:hypothetical protein